MTLHTYTPLTNVPTKYQLPAPYSFSDTARTNFFPPPDHPPAHPYTMRENNTPTALKCCGVEMETPETIRISLQKGEWVTSLDFSDAYFHIPIHKRSQFLRFHFQDPTYQFKAFSFGLSTAPMEFICMVKEVKLMARGIRIPQYLVDWLIQAHTKESCHQGTQSLLALCQELGWVVNLQKSDVGAQTDLRICGIPI